MRRKEQRRSCISARRMIVKPWLWLGVLQLVVTPMSSVLYAAGYTPQPNDKKSTLIASDGSAIDDDWFANQMQGLLTDNGDNNIRNATFLFQQCYGGGFIDDLDEVLTIGNWNAGAASRHDQQSWGAISKRENNLRPPAQQAPDGIVPATPNDFWTKALIPLLNDNNKTVIEAIVGAIAADVYGPSGTNKELPQSYLESDGLGSKPLQDNDAHSFHAILWAGFPNGDRHYNDIVDMYNLLKNKWGDPATNADVSITVLFGDGATNAAGNALPAAWNAAAATKANLETAINDLKASMDPAEDFLFYASDHGGTKTIVKPVEAPPVIVPPTTIDLEYFDLFEGEYLAMLDTPDNIPTFTIDYTYLSTGVSTLAELYLNGILLGELDPFLSRMVFSVSESALLNGTNNVELVNNSGETIELYFKEFFTGSIDTVWVAPEPAALLYCSFGGLLLLGRRRAY